MTEERRLVPPGAEWVCEAKNSVREYGQRRGLFQPCGVSEEDHDCSAPYQLWSYYRGTPKKIHVIAEQRSK